MTHRGFIARDSVTGLLKEEIRQRSIEAEERRKAREEELAPPLSLIETRKANGLPVGPYKPHCYFGRMHHWQSLGDEECCATCGSLAKPSR